MSGKEDAKLDKIIKEAEQAYKATGAVPRKISIGRSPPITRRNSEVDTSKMGDMETDTPQGDTDSRKRGRDVNSPDGTAGERNRDYKTPKESNERSLEDIEREREESKKRILEEEKRIEEEKKRIEEEKKRMEELKEEEDRIRKLKELEERNKAVDLQEKENVEALVTDLIGKGEGRFDKYKVLQECCSAIMAATSIYKSGKLTFLRVNQVSVRENVMTIMNTCYEVMKEESETNEKRVKEAIGGMMSAMKESVKVEVNRCKEEWVLVERKKKKSNRDNVSEAVESEVVIDSVPEKQVGKSYATMLNTRAIRTETAVRSGQNWVTPEKPRHEAIIRIEGNSDGATVLKSVKAKIADVVGRGVKGIKITSGGATIIEGKDKGQIEAIKKELDKYKEFNTRIGGDNKPKIRILGIEDIYDKDTGIMELFNQNPDHQGRKGASKIS